MCGKGANHAKFAYAKASLEKDLFMLSPVFQVRGGGGRGVGFMVGIKGKGRWRQVLAGERLLMRYLMRYLMLTITQNRVLLDIMHVVLHTEPGWGTP